jgi:hypothetical protein
VMYTLLRRLLVWEKVCVKELETVWSAQWISTMFRYRARRVGPARFLLLSALATVTVPTEGTYHPSRADSVEVHYSLVQRQGTSHCR